MKENLGEAMDEIERKGKERYHHYLFAHRLIPKIASKAPRRFYEALLSDPEGQTKALRGLWDQAAGQVPLQLPPDGLRVTAEPFTGLPAGVPVIHLPLPENPPEAYFIALVPESPPSDRVRLFTLDRGVDMDQEEITVVCEWSLLPEESRKHGNLGSGPEPDVTAFLRRLEQLQGIRS